MKPLLAILALALTAALPVGLRAQEAEEILPQTLPVLLDESDPARFEVGQLIYRGGLKVEPGEERIGGISGLEWVEDAADHGGGALYAVSDDGRWLKIVPNESNARLRDLYSIRMGRLRDTRGKPLKNKAEADAEAITFTPDGAWMVAFEQQHRILIYTRIEDAARFTQSFPASDPVTPNNGFETLEIAPGNIILMCAEIAVNGIASCSRLTGADLAKVTIPLPPALAEHGGTPTDAACADDGTCYILIRSYQPGYGNRAAIIELAPDETQTTLAVFDAPLTRDNFEGLAVREQYGKRYLYLASDDNFNNCYEGERAGCQDTLIMKFEIRSAQPPAPQVADAPPSDARFKTLNVVLETHLGNITVALEMERAPITAANFLRYVDEGRFDGTVFYRAMDLDREPKPNGLIQGGTQFDPKRILPAIPHEPTTKTGLSHTNGAISMAMGEPGSSTGDFSIMLQNQTGLDARPDAAEPIWQNGYAVFGYVIEGMDVVAAIHQSGTDPDKGEGWMKGQMLAEPVPIIRARRADTTVE